MNHVMLTKVVSQARFFAATLEAARNAERDGDVGRAVVLTMMADREFERLQYLQERFAQGRGMGSPSCAESSGDGVQPGRSRSISNLKGVDRLINGYMHRIKSALADVEEAMNPIMYGQSFRGGQDIEERSWKLLSRSIDTCQVARCLAMSITAVLAANGRPLPEKDSIPASEGPSAEVRRASGGVVADAFGQLETARETESQADGDVVPPGRADTPSPGGRYVLDDRDQADQVGQIKDVEI